MEAVNLAWAVRISGGWGQEWRQLAKKKGPETSVLSPSSATVQVVQLLNAVVEYQGQKPELPERAEMSVKSAGKNKGAPRAACAWGAGCAEGSSCGLQSDCISAPQRLGEMAP